MDLNDFFSVGANFSGLTPFTDEEEDPGGQAAGQSTMEDSSVGSGIGGIFSSISQSISNLIDEGNFVIVAVIIGVIVLVAFLADSAGDIFDGIGKLLA